MRKLSLFLAFAMVLGLAYGSLAQTHNGIVSIDNITNTYNDGGVIKLNAGKNHAVSLRYNLSANSDLGLWIGSNAWEVYSPDGADWVNLSRADGPLVTALAPTVVKFKKFFTSINDGVTYVQTATGGSVAPGGRTVTVNRVAASFATVDASGLGGYTGGANGIAQIITFSSLTADAGKHLCFDSLSQHGTVAWEWAAPVVGSDFPQWDNGLGASAPRCMEVFVVPNQPPEWCNGTSANISFNHCAEGTYQLCATDPDPQISGGVITYSFAGAAVGNLNLATGAWSWSGPTVPQTGFTDIAFKAYDSQSYTVTDFVLHVTHENRAPTITCPGMLTVSINTCKTQTVTVGDLDVCDTKTVTVLNNGGALGAIHVTGSDIEFCPVAADGGRIIPMVIQVSDGAATATCEIQWNVIVGAPYQVEIQKVKDQIQGQYTDVFIKLHKIDITQGLGGFDFMIAYDASALSFQLASEGDIYAQCGWEYFTYRFGPRGNCGSACPSGQLRIIGLAETNNGAPHPGCNVGHVGFVNTVPVILANMRFLVSNDRTLECQFVPIRFFWYDCGDNVLSNYNGSELYLSQKVFEFTEYNNPFLGGEITDRTSGFPTFTGAQTDCYYVDVQKHKVAKENVDFQNGGIDIICADSIDAPGDVNLNGIPYEIADAVMFTNYFINGLSAFAGHLDGSIAATDTNKDGITLSVADLVYLIRVIIGDALPYAKISPVAARITVGNGIFNVNQAMGAAYVVMAGDVTPALLAGNMEMQYAFNGQNTNILVWSRDGNSFSGDFLQADGDVISTEFAAANGAPVNADVMPANFELHQNYPNPFNPTTTIKVEIPGKGMEWKLNIYNVTGQLVQSFSGVSTGYEVVNWDASNVSSGVYFYKLTAGDYSATKKAVLLK